MVEGFEEKINSIYLIMDEGFEENINLSTWSWMKGLKRISICLPDNGWGVWWEDQFNLPDHGWRVWREYQSVYLIMDEVWWEDQSIYLIMVEGFDEKINLIYLIMDEGFEENINLSTWSWLRVLKRRSNINLSICTRCERKLVCILRLRL